MKILTKTLVGTVAAGAMAMTSAAPAFARDRDNDGISTGEVIAGAVILGGIAAVLASSGDKDRNYRGYDDRGYNNRYDNNRRYGHDGYNDGYNRGNGRSAVQQCVRAAENDARRGGYRYANVTQIRDVDNTRYGWRVKGKIDVQGTRGYRGDSGKFTCDISRGRVVALDYRGIRGLR